MSSYIIYIFLISLWGVILFYSKSFGISVILFLVPLCIIIHYYLSKNKLIKNKKGLLFLIPIILLSLSYSIFNSTFFYYFNVPVIILLLLLMYVYTVKPTYKLSDIISDIGSLLFEPIGYIGKFADEIKNKFNKNSGLSEKAKKNIKSILIIIPIVIVVLVLLMHADSIFKDLFKGIIDLLDKIDIFDGIIGKVFLFLFLLFAIGSTLLYIGDRYVNVKASPEKKYKRDANTIKLLIIILDVIYVVFDYIQIKSLMLHSVSSGIDYATYARQGFFELLAVSIINITIILLSKKFKTSGEKEVNVIKISSIIMVILTTIIIISSFLRMNLYEAAYGYTMLRLLVYISLITEILLLIPTILYIINPKFNVLKYYMIIVISVYTLANYCNLDYMIAKRNLDRYYSSSMKVVNKNINHYLPEYDTYSYRLYKFTNLDLDYLMNDKTDNVSLLIDLYNKTEDPYVIDALNRYFKELLKEDNYSWQEISISKYKAINELLSVKKRNPQF